MNTFDSKFLFTIHIQNYILDLYGWFLFFL